MLPSEAQWHTRYKPEFELPAGNDLGAPDDEVVQQHAADHGEDQTEVCLANPADGFASDVGRERHINVHFPRGEFLGHTRMALSAGARQIRRMNGRTWIARRKNAVRSM